MLNDPAEAKRSPAPQPPSEPKAKAKSRGVGFTIVSIVIGLVVLIVAAGAVFVMLPPAALLTPIIVKAIASQTGRELKVGAATYAFRPDFVLHFDKMSLSNPEGVSGPDLLQADAFDARINLVQLLKGAVVVDELSITQPLLTLHKDASGKVNWALPPQNPNVRIGLFSLQNGTLNYQDDQAGRSFEVTKLGGTLMQNGAAMEAKVSGVTTWRSEPVTLNADISDIQALGAGKASAVTAEVTSKNISASVKGNATTNGLQGTFTASTPSAVELAQWFGSAPPASVRLGAASLAGTIDATLARVALQKTQLTLDGATSTWDVALDLTAKPKLSGSITTPLLDVTALSAPAPERVGLEALSPAPSGVTIVPAYKSLSNDLDKLDQQLGSAPPSVAVQAAAPAPSMWSTAVVDLGALDAVDVDLKAQADHVHVGKLDATGAVATVVVTDGKLNASIQQLTIDNGHVTAQFALLGAQKSTPAQTSVTLGVDNVPVDTILKQFTANAPLTGATKLDVSASGQGRTQRDLVGSLTGKASFSISNGAIAGFDLRNMILQWWQSWSFDPTRKTEFSVLRGNYDIHQGDLRSISDLAFTGKDVDISSNGDINLSTGTIDQSVRLQLTPPPTHLPIPLKVSGTLTSPSVGIDWSGIFSSPTTVGNPSQVTLAPEPLPNDLKQRVQNILTTNANNPKLTPQTRDALQSLLATPAASPPK
jgi:AsmA protein